MRRGLRTRSWRSNRSRGLVVIDEVQRKERLFELLRVLVDRPGEHHPFPRAGERGSGSAAPVVGNARRAHRVPRADAVSRQRDGDARDGTAVGCAAAFRRRSWRRTMRPASGGGTRSSAPSWNAISRSSAWRCPRATMRRFWTMVARLPRQSLEQRRGRPRALGLSGPTINSYLDALVDALVVRRLLPWYENLKKRQVKAPKPYVADTGLLHALLALDSEAAPAGTSQGRRVLGGVRHAGDPRGFSASNWTGATTGPRIRGRSSTCWCFGKGAGSGSSSSARARRASPGRCGRPSRTWGSTPCSSCFRAASGTRLAGNVEAVGLARAVRRGAVEGHSPVHAGPRRDELDPAPV